MSTANLTQRDGPAGLPSSLPVGRAKDFMTDQPEKEIAGF